MFVKDDPCVWILSLVSRDQPGGDDELELVVDREDNSCAAYKLGCPSKKLQMIT